MGVNKPIGLVQRLVARPCNDDGSCYGALEIVGVIIFNYYYSEEAAIQRGSPHNPYTTLYYNHDK